MINEKECEEKRLLSMMAAFVDGEGNISIARYMTTTGNYGYWQLINIGNTDIHLIEWLVENFGGSMPNSYRPKGNRKDTYNWKLSGINSYKILKRIRPYLILKYEQADLAMELYEKVSSVRDGIRTMPYWKRKLAEDLFQRCRELNKRGRNNNDEKVEIVVKVRKDVLDNWLY